MIGLLRRRGFTPVIVVLLTSPVTGNEGVEVAIMLHNRWRLPLGKGLWRGEGTVLPVDTLITAFSARPLGFRGKTTRILLTEYYGFPPQNYDHRDAAVLPTF